MAAHALGFHARTVSGKSPSCISGLAPASSAGTAGGSDTAANPTMQWVEHGAGNTKPRPSWANTGSAPKECTMPRGLSCWRSFGPAKNSATAHFAYLWRRGFRTAGLGSGLGIKRASWAWLANVGRIARQALRPRQNERKQDRESECVI